MIALDSGHERALRAQLPAGGSGQVRLLRSFDQSMAGARDLDVADPYYGDEEGFREVLRQVEAACEGLLEQILARRDAATAR